MSENGSTQGTSPDTPPPDGSPDQGPRIVGAVELLMLDNSQLVLRTHGVADGNLVIQLGMLDIGVEITRAKLKPAPPPQESIVVPPNRAGRRLLGALGMGRPGHG